MNILDKPLSNLQLEIIKLFNYELSETDLIELKRVLANHFAEKASDEMDKLWEKKNWSDETMDNWLEGDSE